MRDVNLAPRFTRLICLALCLPFVWGCGGAQGRGGQAGGSPGTTPPTEQAPAEQAPTEEAPTEQAPAEQASTEQAPTEQTTRNAKNQAKKPAAKPAKASRVGPWHINLSPPAKVGERFKMQVTAKVQQAFITRSDGKEHKSEANRTLKVEAVGEVLEVNARGQVLRSTFTIDSCVGTSERGERDVLPTGTVLTVRRFGPKPRLSSDSGALSRLDVTLLKLVFSTSDPNATDQEMFGTHVAVDVGEEWTIDADKTAELLAKAGAILDPADLSGSTTLEAATPCGATMCVRVLTEFSATGLRMKTFPATANVIDSGITGRSVRTLPLDNGKAQVTTDDSFNMHITVSVVRGDRDIEVEAHVSSREVGVWTPLP